jgi:hypothetical protein
MNESDNPDRGCLKFLLYCTSLRIIMIQSPKYDNNVQRRQGMMPVAKDMYNTRATSTMLNTPAREPNGKTMSKRLFELYASNKVFLDTYDDEVSTEISRAKSKIYCARIKIPEL